MTICKHCNQEIKNKTESISFEIIKEENFEYTYEINLDEVLKDFDSIEDFKGEMQERLDGADDSYVAYIPDDFDKYIKDADCVTGHVEVHVSRTH